MGSVDVAQPVWNTSWNVAKESVDPGLFSGGSCPGGSSCRYSDAAMADVQIVIPNGPETQFGKVAKPNSYGQWSGSTDYSSTFTVIGETSSFFLGQPLDKVGRTTGWTWGPVDQTCVAVSHPSGGTLLCQYYVLSGAGPGDSGSPVFSWVSGSSISAAGLLWGRPFAGGAYIFSPLSGVKSDLGGFSVH